MLDVFHHDWLRSVLEVNETLVAHEDTWTFEVSFFGNDALEVFSFNEYALERSLGFKCNGCHVVLANACQWFLFNQIGIHESHFVDVLVEVRSVQMIELEIAVDRIVDDLIHGVRTLLADGVGFHRILAIEGFVDESLFFRNSEFHIILRLDSVALLDIHVDLNLFFLHELACTDFSNDKS